MRGCPLDGETQRRGDRWAGQTVLGKSGPSERLFRGCHYRSRFVVVRHKGTLRSLRPLPWRRTPALPSSPTRSPVSSATLARVLYSVTNMIRSGWPLHRSDLVFREKPQQRLVETLYLDREDSSGSRAAGQGGATRYGGRHA